MNEILTVVIPSVVTAIIGYIVGFRKNNIDLCGARLDELEKSLVVYNNIIGDMSQKISDLRLEIKSLEASVEKLLQENKSLKKKSTI
jgi:peptidoglycan hydrolase CwlO-like protein